jgi:hypothetical protein
MAVVSSGDRCIWEDLESLSDADDCSATESVRSFMDYMQNDLQEDEREHVELGKLMELFGSEKSDTAKRVLCATITSGILSRKRRRQATLKTVMLMNLHLFETYVKFRGGLERIMVYEIPNVQFNLEMFGDKEVYGYFRHSESELRRLCAALQIPQVIVSSEGDKCEGLHVLCMMCRNCLRPGQTSRYFNCPPPPLEEYIASLL